MKFIKRLLIWIGIAIIPTLTIILVWLCTFGSFDLIVAIHSNVAFIVTGVCAVLGLAVILSLDDGVINEIIS